MSAMIDGFRKGEMRYKEPTTLCEICRENRSSEWNFGGPFRRSKDHWVPEGTVDNRPIAHPRRCKKCVNGNVKVIIKQSVKGLAIACLRVLARIIGGLWLLLILLLTSRAFAKDCAKGYEPSDVPGVCVETAAPPLGLTWVSNEKPPLEKMPSWERPGIKVLDEPNLTAEDEKRDAEKREAEKEGKQNAGLK